MMKNELDGKIMRKLVELRPKKYSYLKDRNDEVRRQKVQKGVL